MPIPEGSQNSLAALAGILDNMDHGLALELDALRDAADATEPDQDVVIVRERLRQLQRHADRTAEAIYRALYPDEFEQRRASESPAANVSSQQEEHAEGTHLPT